MKTKGAVKKEGRSMYRVRPMALEVLLRPYLRYVLYNTVCRWLMPRCAAVSASGRGMNSPETQPV